MHLVVSSFIGVCLLVSIGFMLLIFGKDNPENINYEFTGDTAPAAELLSRERSDVASAENSPSLAQEYPLSTLRAPELPDAASLIEISRKLVSDMSRRMAVIKRPRVSDKLSRKLDCPATITMRIKSEPVTDKQDTVDHVEVEFCSSPLKQGMCGAVFLGRLECRLGREECTRRFGNLESDEGGAVHWMRVIVKYNTLAATNGEVQNAEGKPLKSADMNREIDTLKILVNTVYPNYLARLENHSNSVHPDLRNFDREGMVMEFVEGKTLAELLPNLLAIAPDQKAKEELITCLSAQSIIAHALEISRYVFNPDRHSGNVLIQTNETVTLTLGARELTCARLFFIDTGLATFVHTQKDIGDKLVPYLKRIFTFPLAVRSETSSYNYKIADEVVSLVSQILYRTLDNISISLVDQLLIKDANGLSRFEYEAFVRVITNLVKVFPKTHISFRSIT